MPDRFTMLVEVTVGDINTGKPCDSVDCPVALATESKLEQMDRDGLLPEWAKGTQVAVPGGCLCYLVEPDAGLNVRPVAFIDVPSSVPEFTCAYDSGRWREFDPFCFVAVVERNPRHA